MYKHIPNSNSFYGANEKEFQVYRAMNQCQTSRCRENTSRFIIVDNMSHYKLKEEQVYMVQKLPNMEIHKYTRTLERTPLGNIQDRATNKFALETSKQEVRSHVPCVK